jgi:homoserine dehydrogenase
MQHYNFALIGFGNVHRGLVQLLEEKRSELEALGISFAVTGVHSRRLGFIVNPAGLELKALLENKLEPDSSIDSVPAFLEASQANVLFEASSLEPYTGQPAISYLQAALERGMHAITANKGPIVHAAHELQTLASSRGVQFRFEATFMGGSPIYSLLRECLPLAKLLRFRGLPNGTSTVVLEAWEQGLTYEDGVKRAQEMGIAETDPSMDVDGWDSAVKIVGLANTIMGANLRLEDCEVIGICTLQPEAVRQAKLEGTPIRLVASLERVGDAVKARVAPEKLEATDSLAQIRGSDMIARFEFDVLPAIELVSRDAGAKETAYDMLADFVSIARRS